MTAPRIQIDYFHDIAANGSLEALKQIVEANPSDINLRHSKSGEPPISFAAQSGPLENFCYLLEAGASIDASKRLRNLLFWLAQNTPDVIKFATDPALKIQDHFCDGTNALSVAIVGYRLETVVQIIKSNHNRVFEVDSRGNSPIYWAAYTGNKAVLGLFAQANINYIHSPSYLRGCIDHIKHIKFITHEDLYEDIDSCCRLTMLYTQLDKKSRLKNHEVEFCFKILNHVSQYYFRNKLLDLAERFLKNICEFATVKQLQLQAMKIPVDMVGICESIASIQQIRTANRPHVVPRVKVNDVISVLTKLILGTSTTLFDRSAAPANVPKVVIPTVSTLTDEDENIEIKDFYYEDNNIEVSHVGYDQENVEMKDVEDEEENIEMKDVYADDAEDEKGADNSNLRQKNRF